MKEKMTTIKVKAKEFVKSDKFAKVGKIVLITTSIGIAIALSMIIKNDPKIKIVNNDDGSFTVYEV